MIFDANWLKAAASILSVIIAIGGLAWGIGRSVIALMVIRNIPKNLTRTQKKTMKETYRDTKEFLELAALKEAKEELEESTPDGMNVLLNKGVLR